MDLTINKRFENVSKSKTFQNILDTFSLRNKKVLDLGCSNGEFLAHFGEGSMGTTIIPEEVEEGRARGLNIKLSNIEEEDLGGERFDVIFANNIFEHMQSPHNFLIKIKSFLKPGGVLILGVPCIPYITPLVRLKKFRGALASLHINFFTRSTLAKTAEYAGWKVLMNRGFRFKNRFVDYLLNPIYPHFYLVANVDNAFHYSDKRLKELKGYNN
jgi:SAM-dependent methyltransferase